jgi:membrane protease YdiL (CAAX protease family)
MAYSPGIAGAFLVWRHYGLKGLDSFFRRLTLWRMPLAWWLYLLLGIPAIAYLAAALNGTISDPFPFTPWYQVFPALFQGLFLLGTIEEFGWRGVAQPLLQRKMAPFWAGLIVGIIWATWHLPVFLFGGGVENSAWPIVPFYGGVIALSIILTPMFNSARGSLLIAYLYHFQMMNPIFPDGQPWDNLLFGITAVVIVILNRRTMFEKGTGITEVLFPGREAEITSEADETTKNSLSATAG